MPRPALTRDLPCRRSGRERGFVIVFVGASLILFTLLAGLALGLGTVSSIRLTTQNAANAAALAAIEEWVSSPELGNAARAAAALQRAQAVLNQFDLPGFFSQGESFGDLRLSWQGETLNTGGILRLGRYYPIDPTPNANGPCTDDVYPCFIYYPSDEKTQLGSDDSVVNAAQLLLTTPSNNPILAPFARIFGEDTFRISVAATATLVQRCTAFVVDLSGSSFIDTHVPPVDFLVAPSPFPRLYSATHKDSSAFAFNSNYRNENDSLSPLASIDCSGSAGSGNMNALDISTIAWCNMRPSRWNDDDNIPPTGRPWDGIPMPWSLSKEFTPVAPPHPFEAKNGGLDQYRKFHYRDDFRLNQSAFYNNHFFWIDEYVDDHYKGPEPFTSYMQGFNAALRTLELQQTALDKVTLKGFVGFPLNSIPPFLNGQSPEGSLTSDLGYMIQITNLDNRGTFTRDGNGAVQTVTPEVHPNFIDHGFFSVISEDVSAQSTNLVEILDSTIQELVEYCPANAKKQIILATDGVATCSFVTHTSSIERATANPENRRECVSNTAPGAWNVYLTAEQQLIGEQGYNIPGGLNGLPSVGNEEYPSIVSRLLNEQIAVTVLLAGSYVEPNFVNYSNATEPQNITRTTTGPFLPYARAIALGFSGLNPNSSREFVDYQSTFNGQPVDDAEAFANLGSPGYVFRRPNGTLSRLAMRSGGGWGPLQTPADPACYDQSGNLKDQCRTEVQVRSVLNLPTATLAAQYSSQAVGYNPYMLTEPFAVCENGGSAQSPRC